MLLPYAPEILVWAAVIPVWAAVILRLIFAKRRVKSADRTANCTMISPPTKVEKTIGREILEEFWEEDR
jgi:hypothetical protein